MAAWRSHERIGLLDFPAAIFWRSSFSYDASVEPRYYFHHTMPKGRLEPRKHSRTSSRKNQSRRFQDNLVRPDSRPSRHRDCGLPVGARSAPQPVPRSNAFPPGRSMRVARRFSKVKLGVIFRVGDSGELSTGVPFGAGNSDAKWSMPESTK